MNRGIVLGKEIGVSIMIGQEIPSLVDVQPKQVSKERELLCDETQVNFVRAFLLMEKTVDLATIIGRYTPVAQLPSRIVSPFQVLSDVFISVPGVDDRANTVRAEQVLVKKSIGADSGVVISGPLAGVIVNTNYGQNSHPVAERVWTEQVFAPVEVKLQYPPNILGLRHVIDDPVVLTRLMDETR